MDPKTFLGEFGKTILVIGNKNSGQAVFLKSIEPYSILEYKPKFSRDRKILVDQLTKIPSSNVVGIETNLPSVSENLDAFLKEMEMLAKLNKHIYVMSWNLSPDNLQKRASTKTYLRYVPSVFATYGLVKEEGESNYISRFQMIGNRIGGQNDDCVLQYALVKKDKFFVVETEMLRYRIRSLEM